MRKGGGRILIIIGILLGLVAGGFVFVILTTSQPPSSAPPTQDVVTAKVPINLYAELSGEQLQVTKWPVLDGFPAPTGSFTDPNALIGQMTLSSIPEGAPIVASQVISKGNAIRKQSNLAYILEKGNVGIALPLSAQSSIANALQPGDHVDLIVTLNSVVTQTQTTTGPGGTTVQASRQITSTSVQRTLQNLLVLGVTLWSAPSPQGQQQAPASTIVTLQVTEQDALVVKYLQSTDWTFVLRPVNDDQPYNPTPVSFDYINKKYGFQLSSP